MITACPCECVARESCCLLLEQRIDRAEAERRGDRSVTGRTAVASPACTHSAPEACPHCSPPSALPIAATASWLLIRLLLAVGNGNETTPRNNSACASTRQPLRRHELHSRKCHTAVQPSARVRHSNGRRAVGWALGRRADGVPRGGTSKEQWGSAFRASDPKQPSMAQSHASDNGIRRLEQMTIEWRAGNRSWCDPNALESASNRADSKWAACASTQEQLGLCTAIDALAASCMCATVDSNCPLLSLNHSSCSSALI